MLTNINIMKFVLALVYKINVNLISLKSKKTRILTLVCLLIFVLRLLDQIK